MKYTKLGIENFLDENMEYNFKGEFKLNTYIEIRVKTFKEALKIAKLFKCFLFTNLQNEKHKYYFIYSKDTKKILKLHKLKLNTLKLKSTQIHKKD